MFTLINKVNNAPDHRKKILFLYTELAGYVIACLKKLADTYPVDICVVRWPVNKEAPFQFDFPETILVRNKQNFSNDDLMAFVNKFNPDIIYCSGWIDNTYLHICRHFFPNIPVVVGLDNQWNGSLKQQISSLLRARMVRKCFTHCWIPGAPQKPYALRLGFKEDKILSGLYAPDFDLFFGYYRQSVDAKKHAYPRRFIYVGRYYKFKGITDLWNAFIRLQEEQPNEWELWCIGSGDVDPVVHPKIRHFGFVQPGDMGQYIKDTGVFVLPSRFEPWGVALNEFAAAGFPLVCSREVGAASSLLEDGKNGFVFMPGDAEGLKEQLKKIVSLSQSQLVAMGEESLRKAQAFTPSSWADTLMSLTGNH